MITGHFTTALVPYAKHKHYPLFLLLILTQIQDFLIPLDMHIQNLGLNDFSILEMTYSHDLIPAVIYAVLAFGILLAIYKDKTFALWGGFLIIFHELCDLLAGFSHNVFGLHTHRLGFDYYRTNQPRALLIEAGLATICISYYVLKRKKDGDPIKGMHLLGLVAIVYLPILSMLILALNGQLFA